MSDIVPQHLTLLKYCRLDERIPASLSQKTTKAVSIEYFD
jgi:hypothetical protein